MVHSLDRKVFRGNNIVVKLDMEKAFDKVSCVFLLKLPKFFGFSACLPFGGKLCLSLINKPCRFFSSSRGLRQAGDPLSLGLFILGMELFSQFLSWYVLKDGFKGSLFLELCPYLSLELCK